jgi:dihydroneopterin aldolase
VTAAVPPAVTDASGRPLDTISLVGITAYGRHGVFEHERRAGQQFHVDAVLHLDTRSAAATDDLARTVDYGAVATGLADVIRGEPVNLVETLAQRLAAVCLADSRVVAVDVTVHKPHAPVTERFDDVRLTVRRYRDAPGGAGKGAAS